MNGTFKNGVQVGKDQLVQLQTGDEITILNPKTSATASKAPNYKYMFQELRPAVLAAPKRKQPRLLQNTSFADYSGDRNADVETGAHAYVEVGELGRGSFAVVKKVRRKQTGQEFAMKVMNKKKLVGQMQRTKNSQVRRARACAVAP